MSELVQGVYGAKVVARFWSKVDHNGPWCERSGSNCWSWTAFALKTLTELGQRFGCARSHIGRIVRGEQRRFRTEYPSDSPTHSQKPSNNFPQ